MRTYAALLAVVVLSLVAGESARAQTPPPISPKALWIAASLRSLDVEHRWIAGAHVDWQTGLPDNSPEKLPGRHTHCSAFFASAAKTLGVYVLRPPEHGQVLLANAQFEWLGEAGAAEGWRPLASPEEAQARANLGDLVVASYRSHRDNKPGHIAIVLPGTKSAAEIEADGPDVMQAGSYNSFSTPLAAGFAGHPHAWGDREVAFYAHAVAMPQ